MATKTVAKNALIAYPVDEGILHNKYVKISYIFSSKIFHKGIDKWLYLWYTIITEIVVWDFWVVLEFASLPYLSKECNFPIKSCKGNESRLARL